MKTLNIILLAILVALPIAWYLTRTQQPAQESNTLIVGTNSDYPPFSFIKDGQLTGFEIDIAKEIAHRLHKEVEFKDMAFTNLIPEIQFGNVHMIAAGMTPTEERAKRILFTTPTLTSDPLVIVTLARTPINTLEDVRGKDVVVNEGYAADTYMTTWHGAELHRLTTPADALQALKSGRAVAYVDARAAVMPFFKQDNSANFKMIIIEGTGQDSALGVSPKHADLLPQVQEALDTMQQDGTLDTLKQKWGLS